MTNIFDWSTTPASNSTVGSINWAENQAPSTVNNSSRQEMADVAAWRDFLGGAKIATGTDTLALTSGLTITAYAQGMLFCFENTTLNTGAMTLNVDSVGAKAIVKYHDQALIAGDMEAGQLVIVAYEAGADNFQMLSTLGQAPATDLINDATPQAGGDIDMNGNQMQWSQGADVASATALPVLTDGNYFDVTGTTTVTSIDTTGGAGTVIKLHFDGALTLTHDGTNIILPGGANITTAAGDEAEFIEYGAGTYRCTNYTKATGGSVSPNGWAYVSEVTASSSATVAFTGFETGYDYMVEISDCAPATDIQPFNAQLGVSGPTYRTSGYKGVAGGGTPSNTASTSAAWSSAILMDTSTGVGNNTDETIGLNIEIIDPAAATDTYVRGQGCVLNSGGNPVSISFGGFHTTAEAMDAIQFFFGSGNITKGEFKLYRRPNA